jgi:predicted RNA-binding Zn-ribbon protein involved in translation (DUF1610 family)
VYICDKTHTKPAYKPGLERWSLYKGLWIKYWKEFQNIYDETFKEKYGELTQRHKLEVRKLISCGRFQNGFNRYYCPDCGTMLVVPFTCKSRLCLSCARKRLFGWSLNLSHIMNTELEHTHVTFTIPGTIAKLLFERKYEPLQMMSLTTSLYKSLLCSSAKVKGKEYQPGILATLHKSGNSLNYNPHVHMIATKEFVNTLTGEILGAPFLPYRKIRFLWKKAFLVHLRKQNMINDEEFIRFTEIYKNGFHVYFQSVTGNNNDKLFRTAEYIATGYFHNSQIQEIDNEKRTITFKYKKMVDRGSRQKHFSYKTISIFEFMAKMLYYLPEKHRKMLRYYGIYAHNVQKKLDQIEKNSWAKAIEHSFNKQPEKCPECNQQILHDTVFSSLADKEIRRIMKTHDLVNGYFIPKKKKIRAP